MDKKLSVKTFRNTTLAVVYIFLVSQLMLNGEKIFGNTNNAIGPFVVLLLFSLSAAVVGGLVFGESAILFFENKREKGIRAAIYSIGWLGFYTIIGLTLLAIIQ